METIQLTEKTPTFKRHPDTERLIQLLQTVTVGEQISYDRISQVIGRRIQDNRSLLETARKALAGERYFFLTENGKGLYRGTDAEWMDARSSKTRNNVKRTVHRCNRDLTYIVADELSRDDQSRLALEQTVLSMHEALGRPKAYNTMKMLCNAEGQRLQLKSAAQALQEIL